jgi:hypothetical protein
MTVCFLDGSSLRQIVKFFTSQTNSKPHFILKEPKNKNQLKNFSMSQTSLTSNLAAFVLVENQCFVFVRNYFYVLFCSKINGFLFVFVRN